MNRRDFLRSPRLTQAAGRLAGAVCEAAIAQSAQPVEYPLLRATHRAMATQFEVLLPYGMPDAIAVADTAFEEIDRLEQQLSIYREDSEVSLINRLAAERAVPVERRLFDLLQLARRLSDDTQGAFDITAGPLIKAWGFFKGPPRVPSSEELQAVRQLVGMQHVELDTERLTVRYRRPGVEMNLGSIGKGYALDRAGQRLRDAWGVRDFLLHGGSSSVLAVGNEPSGSHGWLVGIRHPWEPTRRLAMLRLRDQALGTSAATFRNLQHQGRKLGHLLDPRTGWPAQGLASASAIAPTAAEADALATAFFVLGAAWTRAYCERRPEIGAVLLTPDGDAPLIYGAVAKGLES